MGEVSGLPVGLDAIIAAFKAVAGGLTHPYTALSTIFLLIIVSVYHVLERRRINAPGVFELPVIGALPWLLCWAPPTGMSRILDGILYTCRMHDFKTFTIKWLGEKRFIMTSDPANIEHILKKRFANYPKGRRFRDTLTALLGNGIFVSDGDTWQTHRKLASFMFSANNFRDTIVRAFVTHGLELQSILDIAAGIADTGSSAGPAVINVASSAVSGPVVDMFRLLNCFTLDSIGNIAFGSDIGSLRQPDSAFARAFDDAQATLDSRIFTPFWSLWRALGLMPAEKRLDKSVAVMDRFCADLIAARRAAGNAASHGDVLSRFMGLSDDVTGQPLYAEASPANDKALRDVILNFMIAGRDTTAQAVAWTIYELCSNAAAGRPEFEEGVVREARALEQLLATRAAGQGQAASQPTEQQQHGSPQPQTTATDFSASLFNPSYDDILTELPYTKAVVQEALRLHPSVPKDMKEAAEDDTLPDGTHVPKGCYVAYLPHAMGRCDKLWTDPDTFDPGRFLGPQARENLNPYKYIVFNAGPRTCLGQPMALVEACFLLALLYRRYNFSLAPRPGQTGTQAELIDELGSNNTNSTRVSSSNSASSTPAVTYQDSLTLPIAGGLWLRVYPR